MEVNNKKIVCDFYTALAARDTNAVHRLLAPDIDWWFHGPPAHKYNLMQLLTTGGYGSCDNKSFEPLSVAGIGSMVVAEGYHVHDQNRKTYWVHVWTIENGTIITQVKEYLNTDVTITRFKKSSNVCLDLPRSPKCDSSWQSELAFNTSVPRLLLVV